MTNAEISFTLFILQSNYVIRQLMNIYMLRQLLQVFIYWRIPQLPAYHLFYNMPFSFLAFLLTFSYISPCVLLILYWVENYVTGFECARSCQRGREGARERFIPISYRMPVYPCTKGRINCFKMQQNPSTYENPINVLKK